MEPYQMWFFVMLGASDLSQLTRAAARSVVIVTVLAVVAVVFLRRRPRQTEAAAGLSVPAQITPFSVVAFLRRIQRAYAAKLDDGARQSLQTQIREIESAFFSGAAVANSPDLEAVARKWLQTVRED